MHLFLVMLGGGLGAGARYVLQGLVYRVTGPGFPYGTLTVNVVGCLVIGFLMASLEDRFLVAPALRVFLTVGVLGGFTTFSSFSYETMALVRDGSWVLAATNVVGSVVSCLLATWMGSVMGKVV